MGENRNQTSSTPSVTASARPRQGHDSRQIADDYRRQQAARAIAYIQDRYRRGLSIPTMR